MLLTGTGTNCCYLEDLDKVELWTGDRDEPRKVNQNFFQRLPYKDSFTYFFIVFIPFHAFCTLW